MDNEINICRILDFLDSSSESDNDKIIKYILSKNHQNPISKITNFIIYIVHS